MPRTSPERPPLRTPVSYRSSLAAAAERRRELAGRHVVITAVTVIRCTVSA